MYAHRTGVRPVHTSMLSAHAHHLWRPDRHNPDYGNALFWDREIMLVVDVLNSFARGAVPERSLLS